MQMQDVRFECPDDSPKLPGEIRTDGGEQLTCPQSGPDNIKILAVRIESRIPGLQRERMTVNQCSGFNTTPRQCHHRITHIVFQSATERGKVFADVQNFQIVYLDAELALSTAVLTWL